MRSQVTSMACTLMDLNDLAKFILFVFLIIFFMNENLNFNNEKHLLEAILQNILYNPFNLSFLQECGFDVMEMSKEKCQN